MPAAVSGAALCEVDCEGLEQQKPGGSACVRLPMSKEGTGSRLPEKPWLLFILGTVHKEAGEAAHRRCAMTHRLYLGPSLYSTQSPATVRGSESSHTKPSTCLPIGTEPPQLSYSGMTCAEEGEVLVRSAGDETPVLDRGSRQV